MCSPLRHDYTDFSLIDYCVLWDMFITVWTLSFLIFVALDFSVHLSMSHVSNLDALLVSQFSQSKDLWQSYKVQQIRLFVALQETSFISLMALRDIPRYSRLHTNPSFQSKHGTVRESTWIGPAHTQYRDKKTETL